MSSLSKSSSPTKQPATTPKTVVIVGAGLVGALAAVYFAEAGWNVRVYEMRKDLRKEKYSRVRSINLALSHRGIEALRGVRGVDVDKLMKLAVPMRARMIHDRAGMQSSQPYGMHGECIYSIDRRMLNEVLLDIADAHPGVSLHFEHEVQSAQLEAGKLVLVDRTIREPVTVVADLVVGADGAHSAIRRELLRPARMFFQQEYIDHAYLELTIPPKTEGAKREDDRFHLQPNHLHIWPRGSYMMIALANPDGSFTCTLFAPWALLEAVQTPADLRALFHREFADAIPLLPDLEAEFFGNPRGPLMSIKCGPYHLGDRAVILGDAAHAMVPFFGQGMNCGFEDVRVLFEHLRKHAVTNTRTHSVALETAAADAVAVPGTPVIRDRAQAAALASYSATRHPDAVAMCDLAMDNYIEMRSSVASKWFLAQRAVERALSRAFPGRATPLYTLVAFTSTPYAQCIARGHALRRTAARILVTGGLASLASAIAAVAWIVQARRRSGAPLPAIVASALAGVVGAATAPRQALVAVLEGALRVVRG
ncbi:kynurenine 3-monooxygenase, mitochondrial precursor [Blastocladiella emersonii ATCC 22665]|nr:kynurenine 3-monooxygenase, mitochondrial precursor [Blastocladiella emersonii ATCC 22665]